MQNFVKQARKYWSSRQESNKTEQEILASIRASLPCISDEIHMREKCDACIKAHLAKLQ